MLLVAFLDTFLIYDPDYELVVPPDVMFRFSVIESIYGVLSVVNV